MPDDPQAPDPSQLGIPPTPPPDLGQAPPPLPGLAPPQAPPQPPQQPQQQSGPPSPRPILLDLIKGLVHPTAQDMAGARPTSRTDVLESFLGNFMTALGSGFQAAKGPGAALKGFGAAVGAPYQQSVERYQLGQQQQAQQAQMDQEQAKTAQTRAQTEQMGQMVTLPNGMTVPFQLAQKMAPALFGAQGRVEAANVAGQAGIEKAKIEQGIQIPIDDNERQQLKLPVGTTSLPLKQYKTALSAATSQTAIVQGASDSFRVNKLTGDKSALGVGSGRIAATNARPIAVQDPSAPGRVKYVPAGEAMRLGLQAPSSSAVKIPEAVLKDFTSGKSANTLNSFNTATDHLKILSDLGDALDNQSVPLINKFANKFSTAAGGAAPTTFNMAKQAVAGEIAKTFKGQATEGEISAINSTLDAAQSPQQLKGAIGTALTLMNSKREALMKQYDDGIKGQPAFPQPTNKSADTKSSLLKKYGFQ